MVRNDSRKKMSVVTPTTTPQMHGRKVLQVLQCSTQDENILVGSSGTVMPRTSEKKPVPQKVSDPDAQKKLRSAKPKENSPKAVRRSQRKRAEVVSNEESLNTKQKTISSKNSNKKEKASASKSSKKNSAKSDEQPTSKKTPLQDNNVSDENRVPSPVPEEPANEIGIDPEFMYMLNDEVSEDYWKALAEQRQRALDETLRENEALSDQLSVLLAENEQLSAVVGTARGLVSFISANMGEYDDDEPLTNEVLARLLGEECLLSD